MSDMTRALERVFFSKNKDIEGNFYRKEALEEEILFDGQECFSDIQEQFSWWHPGHSLDLAKLTSALALKLSDVFSSMDYILLSEDPEAIEICGKAMLRIVRDAREFGAGDCDQYISEIRQYLRKDLPEKAAFYLNAALSLLDGASSEEFPVSWYRRWNFRCDGFEYDDGEVPLQGNFRGLEGGSCLSSPAWFRKNQFIDSGEIIPNGEKCLLIHFKPQGLIQRAERVTERMQIVRDTVSDMSDLIEIIKSDPSFQGCSWIVGTTNKCMADYAIKNCGFRRLKSPSDTRSNEEIEAQEQEQDIAISREDLLKIEARLLALKSRFRR
jgi:hypothetical protein